MAHDVFKCSQSQGAMQPTSRVAQRAWLWPADAQSCAGVRATPSGLHAGRAHLGRSGRRARRCGIGDRWRRGVKRFLGRLRGVKQLL